MAKLNCFCMYFQHKLIGELWEDRIGRLLRNFGKYLYGFFENLSDFEIGRKSLKRICILSQNKIFFKNNTCKATHLYLFLLFPFSFLLWPISTICFNKIGGLQQLRNHITILFLFLFIRLSLHILPSLSPLIIPNFRHKPMMEGSNRFPFSAFVDVYRWSVLRIWCQFGVIALGSMATCTILIDLLNVLVVEQLAESWPLLEIHLQAF